MNYSIHIFSQIVKSMIIWNACSTPTNANWIAAIFKSIFSTYPIKHCWTGHETRGGVHTRKVTNPSQRQPVMVTLESPVNLISRFLDYEGEPAQADQLVHSNPKPPNQSTFIIFVFLKIGAN